MCLLEVPWHHLHTMYEWLITCHLLLICFSMVLMGRAQDTVLLPLKIAAWEACPAYPCPTEENKVITVAQAKFDSQEGNRGILLLADSEMSMGVFAPISQSQAECVGTHGLLQLVDFFEVVQKQQHAWKMETEEYHYLNALGYVRLVPDCSLKQACCLLSLSCQLL